MKKMMKCVGMFTLLAGAVVTTLALSEKFKDKIKFKKKKSLPEEKDKNETLFVWKKRKKVFGNYEKIF